MQRKKKVHELTQLCIEENRLHPFLGSYKRSAIDHALLIFRSTFFFFINLDLTHARTSVYLTIISGFHLELLYNFFRAGKHLLHLDRASIAFK